MFIDSVELTVHSGKGGQGAVSFRREKFVPKGGPDGGDGGDGGDVYFLVDKNTHTLAHYKGKKVLKAGNGRPGEGRKKHGKNGEDLILIVPPGTQVIDANSGELLLDLTEDGQKLGYVPQERNEILSRLMDAGKLLFGRLDEKNWVGRWLRLDIQVYLRDL